MQWKAGDIVDVLQKKAWLQAEILTVQSKRDSITVMVLATGNKAVAKKACLRRTMIWEGGCFKPLQGQFFEKS